MTTPDRCHEYANEIAGLRRELATAQAAQRASVARIDDLLRDIEQLRGEVILWIEASYAGTKLINEQLAEIERLREVERKALEQSEYIQKHGLTEWEMALKDAEIERLRRNAQPVSFDDRQPDDYQTVLAYVPLRGYGWMRIMFRLGVSYPFTHWLPLPDAPQAALDAAGGTDAL